MHEKILVVLLLGLPLAGAGLTGLVDRRFGARAWWFDAHVVDGVVNGVGTFTIFSGREVRRIQTGRVQNYALGIAIGLLVMAAGFLVVTTR